MEIKKRFKYHRAFVVIYFVFLAAFIIVGLQPAEAVNYEVTSWLEIPSIGLRSDVTSLTLRDGRLDTPDTIVGSYSQSEHSTFLIGHSSTVFQNLDDVKISDLVYYNNTAYEIVRARLSRKEAIDMKELLAPMDKDTLVIMTCAGEDLGGGDATHRLIITAEAR